MQSIQSIYEKHHKENRGEGFSIMKAERGDLLRKYIGSGKNVLDIGCRDGALTSEYSKGNTVLGLDIDEISLQRAKQNLGIETLAIDLNGDWAEIENDKYDVVVAGEIVEHLYHPDETIKKIKKKMKSGGLILCTVPNAFSWKNRLRYFMGTKKATPLADPTHINHFSKNEFNDLLESEFNEVLVHGLGRYKKLSMLCPSAFAFILFGKGIKK